FFSRLSQNNIEILEDDEYYDVTIEVGEDPNVKIFRTHMIILCHRSPFLRRTLASNNNDDALAHIKLPNISPEIFPIILKLVVFFQEDLIENKSEWIEQHFELTHRPSFQSNSLLGLQKFCTDIMAKSPEKVFKSIDFISLPEKFLVLLIKRDDLQMNETEVW